MPNGPDGVKQRQLIGGKKKSDASSYTRGNDDDSTLHERNDLGVKGKNPAPQCPPKVVPVLPCQERRKKIGRSLAIYQGTNITTDEEKKQDRKEPSFLCDDMEDLGKLLCGGKKGGSSAGWKKRMFAFKRIKKCFVHRWKDILLRKRVVGEKLRSGKSRRLCQLTIEALKFWRKRGKENMPELGGAPVAGVGELREGGGFLFGMCTGKGMLTQRNFGNRRGTKRKGGIRRTTLTFL